MRHLIDPTVDFVFKLLFGVEENRDLLVEQSSFEVGIQAHLPLMARIVGYTS